MAGFTIYPAIDLRQGQVVRLAQGDLARQTVYGNDPAGMAQRWLEAGARWLHVVNLDGAFDQPDQVNRQASGEILRTAGSLTPPGLVQFGGGLRSLKAVEQALEAGVQRVVLGTAAIQSPELVKECLHRFGSERVAVGLDARAGEVMLRGWTATSGLNAVEAACRLARLGIRTVIYTDIARDGVGSGVNLPASLELAEVSGLEVIASGGVHSLDDVRRVKETGLGGVIIGRALYASNFTLQEALAC